MAGVINIGGENAGDAFYRYKMPKLQARIEGRGNGIKTNVVNCTEIAKALERPTDYILKFFGTELGAQTKYDKSSGNSIVNGAHDAGKLSELLEGFIKKYVQCYACGNPETVVKVKKENILLKCKACGFVSDVDPRLKLNGYIVKNPPEVKLSKGEKKVKKAEKERMKGLEDPAAKEDKKKKKKDKKGAEEANGHAPAAEDSGDVDAEAEEEEEEEDEVVWMTDTSEAAMQQRAAEQLSAATAAMVTQGNLEAEQEAARVREAEAVRKAEEEAARRKAEEEEAARVAEEARLAEDAARKLALEAVDPTVRAIRELVAAGRPPKEVAAALKEGEVKGGPAARMRLLYEALFGEAGEGEKLGELLAKRTRYLAPHAADQAGQLSQLVAAEHLVGVAAPGRVRETPLMLKAMYDADLVEEDLILAWFNKASAASVLGVPSEAAAAVRAAAKPFVEWLEEAESGSEEED